MWTINSVINLTQLQQQQSSFWVFARTASCTLPLIKSTQMINLLGNIGSNLLKTQFRNGDVIDTKVAELAQTFNYITVD